MKIRIKELYKSDLDPNSNEWWSKDKIDKINFNFNLLRNGGPSGPAGLEGPNGIEGEKGETGTEGTQGPIGNQGIVGPPSEGTWKLYMNVNNHRVIYPGVPEGISGITIPTIGASSHIVDGTQNLISPFYGEVATSPISIAGSGALNIITESPASRSDYANLSNLSSMQLMLDQNHSKSFNLGMFEENTGSSNNAVFKIYPTSQLDANSTYTIDFKGNIVFDFVSNQGNINTIGDNSIINYPIEVDASNPGESITFTVNQTKYNNNASFNNVLMSNDTSGTVTWENVASLFSILPIGSIVRIPSTYFNSDNFYLNDANTTNNGPIVGGNGVYDIRTNFGAGKVSGMFAGWYLCNGLKWGDGAVISYSTPNLNGFSYSFDDIPSTTYGESGPISGGNSHSGNIIYAGANSSVSNGGAANSTMVAADTANDLDNYIWNSQINSTDENHIVFGEQVSIIFLGDYNYIWSNYDPNLTTTTVDLSYHSIVGELDQDGVDISMQYSATLSPENMEWTANITPGSSAASIDAYWNNNSNFDNQGVSTGIRCYQSGVELSTGWLWRASKCRYYETGIGFTGEAVAVEPKQLWVWYDESVNGVDGRANDVFANTSFNVIPESSILNNNTLALVEAYTSNRVEGSPYLLNTYDWDNWTNTSHIWTVSPSNEIVKPTTGWYRSIPYSDAYLQPIMGGLGGGGIQMPAGYQLRYRKYWNNSSNTFVGDYLADSHIPWSIGEFTFASGTNSVAVACNSTTGYDVFFATDPSVGNLGSAYEVKELDEISEANEGISWSSVYLYVREDASPQTSGGSLANKGKYPLRKIKLDTFIPGSSTGLIIKQINSSSHKEVNSSSIASSISYQCTSSYIPPTASLTVDGSTWNTNNAVFIDVNDPVSFGVVPSNFQAGSSFTYSWTVGDSKFIISDDDAATTDVSFFWSSQIISDLEVDVTGTNTIGLQQTVTVQVTLIGIPV